jgi:hypothetical protein
MNVCNSKLFFHGGLTPPTKSGHPEPLSEKIKVGEKI